MSRFKPQDELEKLILDGNSAMVVQEIVEGKRLSRPDVFSTEEFNDLTLRCALTVALLGYPAELRPQALEHVRRKSGEDSEVYDFLSVEFEQDENPPELTERERRLLAAIEAKDEIVVAAMATNDDYAFGTRFPLKHLAAVAALSEEVRDTLLKQGLDVRAQVPLIRDLLAATEVAPEVASLSYDDKCDLITVLANELMADDAADDDDFDDFDDFDDEEAEDDLDDEDDEAEDFDDEDRDDEGEDDLDEEDDEDGDDEDGGGDMSEEVREEIFDFLTQRHCHYDLLEDGVILIHHPMEDPLPDLEVIVHVLPVFVLIHACIDDVCPEENLPALAEYLARVNCALPNGNFDLSYDKGMVSFRVSELNAGFLYGSQAALASLVEYPEMIVRQYVPQMLEVMQGKDPKKAFEEARQEEE